MTPTYDVIPHRLIGNFTIFYDQNFTLMFGT